MQDLGFSQRVDKDSYLFGQILAEGGNNKLLSKVRSYLPIDMASYRRRSKRIPRTLTACFRISAHSYFYLFILYLTMLSIASIV